MVAVETHLRYSDGIERNDLGLKEKTMRGDRDHFCSKQLRGGKYEIKNEQTKKQKTKLFLGNISSRS